MPKFAAALFKNDRIHYQSMYQLQKLVTSVSTVKIMLRNRRRVTWNGISMLNISHHRVYMYKRSVMSVCDNSASFTTCNVDKSSDYL